VLKNSGFARASCNKTFSVSCLCALCVLCGESPLRKTEYDELVPRWLIILLKALCVTVAWAAAVIVFAWVVGRLLSDRFGWSQWLLWMPTPALFPITLLGLLGAMRPGETPWRRRRIVLWCACIVSVVLYFSVIEHRFLRGGADAPTGVRLVHWNMLDHQYGGLDRHVEAMINLDADITIISNPGRTALDNRTRQWMNAGGGAIRWNWPFAVCSRLDIVSFRILASVDDIVIGLAVLDATETLGRDLALYFVDLPSDPRLDRASSATTSRRGERAAPGHHRRRLQHDARRLRAVDRRPRHAQRLRRGRARLRRELSEEPAAVSHRQHAARPGRARPKLPPALPGLRMALGAGGEDRRKGLGIRGQGSGEEGGCAACSSYEKTRGAAAHHP
jgi:hypothetical protein